MANKQPQVTEQTRANLTRAFWDIYLKKPIEKITIREITDRAGYNRATFYLYYRDVYDLFEQIERGVLKQVDALVNERLLAGETLDFSEHMGVIVGMAQSSRDILPTLLERDSTFEARFKQIIAPLLDRFILPGEGLSGREQGILREFYLSGLIAAISEWLREPGGLSIGGLIGLIVEASLHGAQGARSVRER